LDSQYLNIIAKQSFEYLYRYMQPLSKKAMSKIEVY
jgi:hypothetical protein